MRTAFIALCLALLTTRFSCAESSAEEMLAQCRSNSAEKVVRSADIRFSADVQTTPPSDEQIKSQVAFTRSALLQDRAQVTDPRLLAAYDKALRECESQVSSQMMANAVRTIAGVFLMSGPPIGGDTLYETRVRRGSEDQWSGQSCIVTRLLGNQQRLCVSFDPESRVALASGREIHAGVQPPHWIGRLQGRLLEEPKGDGPLALEAAFSKGAENDAPAPREVDDRLRSINVYRKHSKQRELIASFTCDPSRGYICPSVKEFDEAGTVVREWACDNYFRDDMTGVWFPGACLFTARAPGKLASPSVVKWTFDSSATTINRQIPQARFACSVPAGMSLISELEPASGPWIVSREVSLSPDNIERLGSLPGLTLAQSSVAAGRKGAASETTSQSWWPLLAANFAILAAVAIYLLRRKRVASRSLTAGMIGCALIINGSLSGCSPAAESAAQSGGSVPQITSDPPTVDFGRVAADGRALHGSIRLSANTTGLSLPVQITSGCGCTTLGTSNVVITSADVVHIPFSITTTGRTGPFETSVMVRSMTSSGAAGPLELAIPVRATFLRSLFATPNRLFLAVSPEDMRIAKVTILSSELPWTSLDVVADSTCISVQQLPPSDALAPDSRVFAVTAVAPIPANCSMSVRVKGQENAALTIPIIDAASRSTAPDDDAKGATEHSLL